MLALFACAIMYSEQAAAGGNDSTWCVAQGTPAVCLDQLKHRAEVQSVAVSQSTGAIDKCSTAPYRMQCLLSLNFAADAGSVCTNALVDG